MKITPLALAFAIGPFGLAAQATAAAPTPAPSSFRIPAPVVDSGCPVSMGLQQKLGNQAVTVQNDGRVYKAPATHILLTIPAPALPGPGSSFGYGIAGMAGLGGKGAKTEPPPITPRKLLRAISATATAYGFGGRPRAELASRGRRGNSWSGPTRDLQLHFNAKDGGSVAELWLPSFGAIRWLDIESIAWSDGSAWKPAKGQACIVTPSLFMLVGANSQTAGN